MHRLLIPICSPCCMSYIQMFELDTQLRCFQKGNMRAVSITLFFHTLSHGFPCPNFSLRSPSLTEPSLMPFSLRIVSALAQMFFPQVYPISSHYSQILIKCLVVIEDKVLSTMSDTYGPSRSMCSYVSLLPLPTD